jgi:hypothetical protein
MAIKIGGTTVIDDSRNLVNIVSGAGVTVNTTTYTPSFSGNRDNIYFNTDRIFGTSAPTSNHAFVSHSLNSNTKLFALSLETNSGPVDHQGTYYGTTLAVASWDGSALINLGVLFEDDYVVSYSVDETTLDNKLIPPALYAKGSVTAVYGLVVSTYSIVHMTHGASWSAGDVTMKVTEIS